MILLATVGLSVKDKSEEKAAFRVFSSYSHTLLLFCTKNMYNIVEVAL